MEQIAFYDAKPYDKTWFNALAPAAGISIRYLENRLDQETALLAHGCRAACIFVSDTADEPVLKELSALRGSGRKGYLHKGEKTRLRGKCFEALVYPDKGNFHLAFRQDAELIYDGKILTFRLGKSGFGRKERKCCLPDLAFLRIFSDVSSLEIFADGEVFSTRLFEEEGESRIQELALWDGFCRWEMYPLHPFVWDNKE